MAPLAHALALLAMTAAAAAIEQRPLDMARSSFDDQYLNCGPAMAEALPALNRSDVQQNPLLAEVWAMAKVRWQDRGSRVSPLSSSAQAIALMAYTMDDLYKEFNAAVRVAGHSGQEYRDNFHFKALHFLLTQALARLRVAQGQRCYDVLRGCDILFQAQPGDTVRFGQFASTSLSEKVARKFGPVTIFHVHTCHGADIQNFSWYPKEKEVLIPPFETFKVTEVTWDWKKVLHIHLHSTRNSSAYNCEWLRGGSLPRDHPHLLGLLLATAALAVATGTL